MSHPQLDNLARIGQLKLEPPAEGELRGLVRSGTRRLDDAAREELSAESRFDLAYNASHALTFPAWRIGRSKALLLAPFEYRTAIKPSRMRVATRC